MDAIKEKMIREEDTGERNPSLEPYRAVSFTPGPWSWSESLVEPNGTILVSISSDTKDVAYMTLNQRELRANARLIAAAPEIYEAATKALNYIENTEGELGITLQSGEALRAALAKANPSAK